MQRVWTHSYINTSSDFTSDPVYPTALVAGALTFVREISYAW